MKLNLLSIVVLGSLVLVLNSNSVFAQDFSENPVITLNENDILLYNGVAQVSLATYAIDDDSQIIWKDGDRVGVNNGGEVDLSEYRDNTDDQFLYKFGHNVFLRDGSQFNLEGYMDNTDAQNIDASLQDTMLNISIDNGNDVAVDMTPMLSETKIVIKSLLQQMETLAARVEELEACGCSSTSSSNDASNGTQGDFGSNDNQEAGGPNASTPNEAPELDSQDSPKLFQNIPNPFQATSSIKYYVPQDAGSANITFSNTSGKVVSKVNVNQKGNGELDVNSAALTSGVYLYTLYVDGKLVSTRKMVVNN